MIKSALILVCWRVLENKKLKKNEKTFDHPEEKPGHANADKMKWTKSIPAEG